MALMPSNPHVPASIGPTSRPGPHRAADYFALDDEERCELIHGYLHVSPSPTTRHQLVVGLLYLRLKACVRDLDDLVLMAPLDTVLSDLTVVQPDVLIVRAERRSVVGERIEGAPDLVVEVLSPSTAHRDREEKLAEYAKAGVREFWLVDPLGESMTFLVLENGKYHVELAIDGIYASRCFSEVTIDLVAFWKEMRDTLGPGNANA